MSDYDKEQKSELVKQHHRLAMGVPLDGQTLKSTGEKTQSDNQPKPSGNSNKQDK